MRMLRMLAVTGLGLLALTWTAHAADPSWPKEMTFALLSTENAAEITRRWGPILAQLESDLGVKIKPITATDYRGTIEALKFKKAELGHLGPKSYVAASANNYANVEPIAQLQLANGSLGYRSCLIVHTDSDIFSPEDLGGKTFAFNDPNSTSGYLVPSAFFMMEMNTDPARLFSKVTFSGSHEASILAVANKKVDVASTNLPDLQQLTRENKVPARRAARDLGVEADPQRSHRGAQGHAAEPQVGDPGVAHDDEGAPSRDLQGSRRLGWGASCRPTTASTRSCASWTTWPRSSPPRSSWARKWSWRSPRRVGRWMSVLAQASPSDVEEVWQALDDRPPYRLIRGPEIGSVMVRGRAGGTGAPFCLGEMTVTRCSVALDDGRIGHAYVGGRSAPHAEHAAVLDALLQDPALTDTIAMVSLGPASHVGLDDRGEIAVGKRADLVRVRLAGDLPVVRGVWCRGERVA